MVYFLISHVCLHQGELVSVVSAFARRDGALISSMARALSSLLYIECKHEVDVCLGCFG
jgi:hypothetical protein